MTELRSVLFRWCESPYCQFCIFELDCNDKSKFDAREEGETDRGYHVAPSCFQCDTQHEEEE